MAFKHLIRILTILSIIALSAGCGGGGSGSDDNGGGEEIPTGEAILDIQLATNCLTCPRPATPEGYTLLDFDLNEGTGGNYVWLYYKVGKADGSEGTPIRSIYTQDEYEGESPRGGTKLPVNLNANDNIVDEGENIPLWLWYTRSSSPVVRCIVVYYHSDSEQVIKYAPPEAEGKYDIVWVQELSPDVWTSPYDDVPPNSQDLNENQATFGYIYIGYGVD